MLPVVLRCSAVIEGSSRTAIPWKSARARSVERTSSWPETKFDDSERGSNKIPVSTGTKKTDIKREKACISRATRGNKSRAARFIIPVEGREGKKKKRERERDSITYRLAATNRRACK